MNTKVVNCLGPTKYMSDDTGYQSKTLGVYCDKEFSQDIETLPPKVKARIIKMLLASQPRKESDEEKI